jgi:ketosteroid isomerase-like protein
MTMNLIRRLSLMLVWFASAVAVATAAESSATEAEILKIDASRVDALLKNDLGALERLFADRMIYIHANGRIDTKQGYLGMLRGGNLIYVGLRYDPAPRVVVAGDTALVTGKATIDVKNKAGQVTQRVLTTTTVYVRAGASWQVVSYQGTPVQP